MGVRYDVRSLKEAHRRKKSMEQLTAENKELREKLQLTETSLVDTQMALCEIYELLAGGDV